MYNPPLIEKNEKMPTILVAGGAGYLGLALTESLLEKNFRVVIVDNLESSRREDLLPFLSHPRLAFFDHDLNLGLPDKIISVDYIFHLAAHEAHLFAKDLSISLDSLLTNALTTFHLLELTKAVGARFLFASSVDIYQGLASSGSLDTYFGEAADERIFSHAEAKRFGESLVWEYYKKYNLDVRIARLGEIFGPKMNLTAGGQLGRLVQAVIDNRELTVEGDGLDKEYYCYIKDAVRGVENALLKENTKGRIYPICDLQPITILEEAYVVKKLSPKKTEVVFKPTLRHYRLPEIKIIDGHTQQEIAWQPEYNFKAGVRETLLSLGIISGAAPASETAVSVQKSASETKGKWENFKLPISLKGWLKANLPAQAGLPTLKAPPLLSLSRLISFFAALVIVLALNPLTIAGINLYLGQRRLVSFENNLRTLKTVAAKEDAAAAANHFLKAKNTLNSLPMTFDGQGEHLFSAAYLTARGLESLADGLQPFTTSLSAFGYQFDNQPDGSNPVDDFTEKSARLNEAEENFSLASGELKSLKPEKLPFFLQPAAEKAKQQLPVLDAGAKALIVLSEDWPEIFGFNGARTYLVLFQNSNELRPTGGFIGSYARFDLDKGKLTNLKIDDIYNPDGQLDEKKIIYPVPRPLKDNLKIDNLRIRDANWSPDFPATAKTIADLYEKATGEKSFGIVALNLVSVSRLLAVTGPINLPTFNETVTSENLFEKAEFRSEAGFFPGSNAKKTFLSALGESLLEKLLNPETANLEKTISALIESLKAKDLLVTINRPRTERLLSEMNWNGTVRDSAFDYLNIVEANVGATKSNYFIRRSLHYIIDKISREGEMEANLNISYIHTGESNAWPGGPYKSYLRLYVPKRTALLKVLRSTENIEGKGEDITENVKIGEEFNKTVFEILFELKAGESLSLNFSYVIPPEVLNIESREPYRLLFQKQPGAGQSPLTFDFTPPFGKTVKALPTGSEKLGQIIRWKGALSSDLEFEIPFE